MPAGAFYKMESFVPGRSIGFLVKRCGVLMSQLAERRFAACGISFTQWTVLMALARQSGPRSATQLSRELGHDMGALTRVVDELERRALVRRARSSRDRRAVELAITPAGRRHMVDGKRVVVCLLNQLVEPYSRAETERLIDLLGRMHAHLQRTAAAATAATAEVPAPRARAQRPARARPAVPRPRSAS